MSLMIHNFMRSMTNLVRQQWVMMAQVLVIMGVVLCFADLFGIHIPQSIPEAVLILALVMALMSERILNNHLPIVDKAAYRFAIYTLLFFVLRTQLQARLQGNVSICILLLVALALIALVFYEVRQMNSQTDDKREARRILFFGLAAIICIAIAMAVSLVVLFVKP